jgi:hypothetical protein
LELSATVEELKECLVEKTHEIATLRTELLDIASLKSEIVKLRQDNEAKEAEILELKRRSMVKLEVAKDAEILSLNDRMSKLEETLSAREIGNKADMKTLKYIFETAPKRPVLYIYCIIRTFSNLSSFIKDPAKKAEADALCMPGAVAAWMLLDEGIRTGIKDRNINIVFITLSLSLVV